MGLDVLQSISANPTWPELDYRRLDLMSRLPASIALLPAFRV